jgi:hypothetical protein
MKKIIPIVLLLAATFGGCKKSSDATQSNTTTALGTGGLDEQQTFNILVGDWKYADSIITNYYDANNSLIVATKTVSSFPYWGITQYNYQGAIYCNIQTSDYVGINPSSGGELSTAAISLFNGVTTLTINADKYVITSISASQMNITYTPTPSSFSFSYALSGKIYTAAAVNQKLTFTKYK